MKALIIAAGRGKRLKELTKDKPKALINLLGLSLIERIILAAKKAGINEFFIVVGYLGEKIKAKLGNGEKYAVKIEYIENDEWTKGNGVSVLKAKEFLKENFILLMSDHIFEAEVLKKLKEVKLEDYGCVLCVDRNPKSYIDLEDATKVKVEKDKIIAIGKDLKDYNAIDCGIFLCSPLIFEALEESIKAGDESLSGGVKILAKREKALAFDIGDSFWIDLDTKESCRKAEELLLKKLIKPTDGPVARLINRPISTRLSKLLVNINVKPNFITLISFFLAVFSAFLFSLGNYLSTALGGILAQIASIIDGCDGEIARLKFQESSYGAWLDSCLDRYADALIIFGMSYGYWLLNADARVWFLCFAAMIGSFMNSYTADKYDTIFKTVKPKKWLRLGRDVRMFLIMLGSILNQILLTLFVLGVITNLESIRRLIVLRKEIS